MQLVTGIYVDLSQPPEIQALNVYTAHPTLQVATHGMFEAAVESSTNLDVRNSC